MKETKQKSLVLIITTIALFVIAIIGATYAYFATTTRIDANIGVNIETAGTSYTFTASSSDRITMNITAADMAESNVSSEKIKSETGTINVSLASPTDDIITSCSYDIIWVWESNQKYTASEDGITLPYITDETLEKTRKTREEWDEELAEAIEDGFTAEDYALEMFGYLDNAVYPYEFSTKVHGYKEHDVSNLEAGKTPNSVILQKGVGISSKDTTEVTQTHTVEVSVYNLPVVQEKLYDKTFAAHITIENVKCTMTDSKEATSLATYITNNVYTSAANQASITAATKGSGLYKHSTDNLTALPYNAQDDSYRYSGADEEVNNYVCFAGSDCTIEDNLYRIISIDSTNKTKIIKATNVGMMRWTNGPDDYDWRPSAIDINNFEGSILDTYLNGEYLRSLGNKASLIDTTTWRVGGIDSDTWSVSGANGIYSAEISSTPIYNAKVGLMYIHEYMYAALPEFWTKLGYNWQDSDEAKDYSASKGKDWMFAIGLPWTISREIDFPFVTFNIFNDGVVGNGVVKNAYATLPVFTLIPSAKLINAGTEAVGSKSNPMIIV